MKRKNYIFSLASALLMGTMALSLTACSSEDNIANNTQQPAQGEVRTYTVSIPATFSDNAGTRAVAFDNSGSTPAITTKFVENEKVYVYDKTTSKLLTGYLVVKNVSADKQSCELQGQLTGTISADDEVALLYNLNEINAGSGVDDFYYKYYSTQDGTAEKCVDGAMATMKVKEIDASNNYKMTFYATTDNTKTQAKAVFTNVQSMFRFKFADDAVTPTTPIKVKTLNIQSKKLALADRYYPMASTQYSLTGSGIDVTPATATDDYLYVALCFDENRSSGDELYFCVTDGAGNAYMGTKSAPTGGFKNGKYYYNTDPILLHKQIAPTITWTYPSTPVVADANLIYSFDAGGGGGTPYDITISNDCSGYGFKITSSGNTGTITLNSLNATWKNADPTTPFISVTNGDVLFELTDANSITCNTYYAIHGGGNVKFSCTGASATLTVTASRSEYCGILGDSNYKQNQGSGADAYNNYPTTTELDVTLQLAAPGYTVTRSACTANVDGTYTWTYTVRPVPLTLTTPAVGEVIGSDGKNYAYASLPSGVTAVAKICYVNGEHGLALALADEGYMNWSDAISTCAAHTPAFSGGTWKLATQDEWNNMISGVGGAVALRDGFTSVGGTNMGTGWYWSYTDATDTSIAWVYRFDGSTDWAGGEKGNSNYVRACLAF